MDWTWIGRTGLGIGFRHQELGPVACRLAFLITIPQSHSISQSHLKAQAQLQSHVVLPPPLDPDPPHPHPHPHFTSLHLAAPQVTSPTARNTVAIEFCIHMPAIQGCHLREQPSRRLVGRAKGDDGDALPCLTGPCHACTP